MRTNGARRRALVAATVLVGLAALGVALIGVPDAVARVAVVTAAPGAPGAAAPAAPASAAPAAGPGAPSAAAPAAPSSPGQPPAQAPAQTPAQAPAQAPGQPPGRSGPAVLARLPADTTQALVVDAPGATATTATVTGWRRSAAGWEPALGPFPARLGRAGIGASSEDAERTPAGTFGLTRAFGRAPDPGSALPYREVGRDDWWVSDPASPAYNTPQTCAPGTCPFDERRGENLDDAGHAYDHALVIDANTAPARPGAGSAYFLHIGDAPTAGCVAAAEDDVVATLRWLRPDAHPRISLGVGAGG